MLLTLPGCLGAVYMLGFGKPREISNSVVSLHTAVTGIATVYTRQSLLVVASIASGMYSQYGIQKLLHGILLI